MDYFEAFAKYRSERVAFDADRLRALLKEHKKNTRETMTTVCRKLGLHPASLSQTLHKAEAGNKVAMNKATAVAIADRIGCDWREFAEELTSESSSE